MKKKTVAIVGIILIVLGILFSFIGFGGTTSKRYYTVSFDTAGGTSISSIRVRKGDSLTVSELPEKEGSFFEGWYLKDGTPYDFTKKVEGNMKLYAHWVERTGKDTYLVSFNSNGGTVVSNAEVNAGEKVAEPPIPTKQDFIFAGWYTESGYLYNFETPVEEDLTLTALWNASNKNAYTITFDSNGGSYVASSQVESGKYLNYPSEPVREGYLFLGWYLEEQPYDFTVPVTSDFTLVAKWQQKSSDSEEDVPMPSIPTVPTAQTIQILDKNISMKSLENKQISYEVIPAGSELLNVFWESSDPDILTVSESGMITALKGGDVTITVKIDGVAVDHCAVHVEDSYYYKELFRRLYLKDTSENFHTGTITLLYENDSQPVTLEVPLIGVAVENRSYQVLSFQIID